MTIDHSENETTLDEVTIEITWREDAPASIEYIFDNNREIAIAGRKPAPLLLRYRTIAAAAHLIYLGIKFPGRTLTALRAFAQINGGARRKLESLEEDAVHFWKAEGTVD